MSDDGFVPVTVACPDPGAGQPGSESALVWWLELARVPWGLIDAHLPVASSIPARAREQLILVVAEQRGGSLSAWVHGTWLEFLGDRDPDEALEPLFRYACSCTEQGRPLDPTTLEAVYPARTVRSARAVVASGALGAMASSAVDRLAGRLGALIPVRRRSAGDQVEVDPGGPESDPMGGSPSTEPAGEAPTADESSSHALSGTDGGPGWSTDLIRAAMMAPAAVPMLAIAAGMRLANALAPVMPTIELSPDDDADLAVHLLAEAVPVYLAGTTVRTLALALPRPVSVAVCIDDSTATLRIGRGRIGVSSGVAPEAIVVIEGGGEPLLKVVASSILRDLGPGRPLRRSR